MIIIYIEEKWQLLLGARAMYVVVKKKYPLLFIHELRVVFVFFVCLFYLTFNIIFVQFH